MAVTDLSLQPTSRVDFISLFSMPGYELESIVGTTYCLNYETLLMLILGAVYGPGADQAMEHHSGEINPGAIFAAIERLKGKLKVYCQIDKIDMGSTDQNKSKEIQKIKSLLDEFIEPVPMKKIGNSFSSFHPKIWQICFKTKDGERRQRFAVTSRNLTSNRDFDAVAVFEQEQENPLPLSPDSDFFKKNSFPVTEEYLKECHSVISPFLDAKLLKSNFPKLNIFSLRSEIDKVWKASPDLLKRYDFYYINPALEAAGESGHSSIHAKLYIGKNSVILGSSNFTYRGWYQNREFNVKLDRGIEKEKLLKQLTENSGGIFVPYTPPSDSADIPEDQKETLQELACLSLEASWTNGELSLQLINPFKLDLSIFQWKPFFAPGNEWKNFPELKWELDAKDVCKIFLCKVNGQEIPMMAALTGNTGSLWNSRFAEARKILTLSEELEYRILMAESAEEIFGRDVPLKRDNHSGNRTQTPPRPPIFERLLKMKHDELERFFSGDIKIRENDSDPLGLVQAFYELKAFFGFGTECEK